MSTVYLQGPLHPDLFGGETPRIDAVDVPDWVVDESAGFLEIDPDGPLSFTDADFLLQQAWLDCDDYGRSPEPLMPLADWVRSMRAGGAVKLPGATAETRELVLC